MAFHILDLMRQEAKKPMLDSYITMLAYTINHNDITNLTKMMEIIEAERIKVDNTLMEQANEMAEKHKG